jgi:flagellar hook-length control protein FliK
MVDLSPKPAGPAGPHAAPAAAAADALPPEARFAAANHENIVKGMHAEVLPNGGTMRIRLDPPQLGALQVTVHVRDGVVTASFETSNDEATRLLGHSLNQLKAVLESHGVGVEKLQVQQAPRDEHANAPRDGSRDDGSRHQGQTPYEQEQAARQEQQRKEMLRKMWRRLSGGADPLDVTV